MSEIKTEEELSSSGKKANMEYYANKRAILKGELVDMDSEFWFWCAECSRKRDNVLGGETK